MFRCPLYPPLANCPFDIGIKLFTSLCSSSNSSSSSSSSLNIFILFSSLQQEIKSINLLSLIDIKSVI